MIYTISLALMLATCKHSPDTFIADTTGNSYCTEPSGDTLCNYNWLVPEPATFYIKQLHAGNNFKCPSINPNNPNQFVCFKQSYSFPSECFIITYDLSTNIENVLFSFSGSMIGNLSWGKQDWIAFTTGPGTIRVFKSDGSHDHQIVETSRMNFGSGAGPAWSPDGNHLYYYTLTSGGMVCDTLGNIISNHEIITMPSWNSDDIIIGGGGA